MYNFIGCCLSHQLYLSVSFRVTVEIGWRPVIAVTATLVATHMELSHEAKDLALAGKMACFNPDSFFQHLLCDVVSISFPFISLAVMCASKWSRSAERPTGDLRERMKNKRQDVDPENLKRDPDEPISPTARVSSLLLQSLFFKEYSTDLT